MTTNTEARCHMPSCPHGSECAHATPAPTQPDVQGLPEPFGYFRPDPFGWTDCAKEAEGARPLYDLETVDKLQAEIDATRNALRLAVRRYVVDDQAWAPEIETDKAVARLIAEAKEAK
jgi:hypothetical protein